MDQFIATTLQGLEPLLTKEIKDAGGENVKELRRAVSFNAGTAMLYKLNLNLRTALRILLHLKTFHAKDSDSLYREIYKMNWQDYFHYSKSIAVKAVVHSREFPHSHFVALKTKDAVVDKFRNVFHLRPGVDTKNPDIIIHVHISETKVDISLDSSGEPLYKRGYRSGQFAAPLNEVLAAGMIMMTGWKGDSDFVDPMCGSGTLPIEAAMIAKALPPGIFRKNFSFFHWKDFDETLYGRIRDNLLVGKEFKYSIIASDSSGEAIRHTRQNIKNTMLDDLIVVQKQSFQELLPPSRKGVILINPPYDERMKEEDVVGFYQMIGNQLKQKFHGYNAWVLSANYQAMKHIGLKPSSKTELLNGKLKCKYYKYELFKGKRADKLKKENDNE